MKRVFVIFFILIGVGCSLLYYSWRQATQLPEWYSNQLKGTPNTVNLSNSSEVLAIQAKLQEKIDAKIAQSLANRSVTNSTSTQTDSTSNVNSSTDRKLSNNQNVEIELSNQEVNELVIAKVARQQGQSKILDAASGLQTTIKDGVLESGAVVNLANIPRNELAPRETQALDKVVKTFPMLENKELYLGISGKPRIENGQLKLDENTQVKLGNLSLSLAELSQRLGIPQEQLEQKLSLSLQLGRLKVNDMTLADDKVLLKGSVD